MTLLSPMALWALLAVPAVVALHMLRRRVVQRRVAALFLFGMGRVAAAEGPRRTRLLRTPSFWLELAAAILIALWLSEPALGVSRRTDVVVVLDSSASMAARGVAARVEAECERLAGDVRLLTTGPRPQRLASLDDWAPALPDHDATPALVLAAELAGPAGRVLFLTDRLPASVPSRTEVVALGRPLPNVALVDARRSEGRVFLGLRAWSAAPVEARLTVAGASRTLSVAPGRVVRLQFGDPAPKRPLLVRLGDDALAIDNEWTLLPDPVRVVAVANALPPAHATALRVEAALGALESIAVRPSDIAHLVLGTSSPPVPGRWELRIGAGEGARATFGPPFLFARPEALLEGVTLADVIWSAGSADPPGEPLVQSGDRVLVSRQGRRLHLNLDPETSTLAASSAWPILLANLVELVRADRPGPVARNVFVGERLGYRRSGGAAVHVVDPDGRRREGYGGALVEWDADRPGRWTVPMDSRESGEEETEYSVLFLDPRESDLSGAHTGRRAAVAARPDAATEAGAVDSADTERSWLAVLVLACLAADWWWLARPRRVAARAPRAEGYR